MPQERDDSSSQDPASVPDARLSNDEIRKLRDVIMANARQTVDPHGIGFDALMVSTDDSSFFHTDDVAFKDWWEWVQQIVRAISDGSTRIGSGVIAAGGAIASSLLYGTERGVPYAGVVLIVSGAFAVWFAISAAMTSARSGR